MQTIWTPEDLAEVIELTGEPTRFTALEDARIMVREAIGLDADADVDELMTHCFAWYQAADARTGTITASRQGFYQCVTPEEFWKEVERLGL